MGSMKGMDMETGKHPTTINEDFFKQHAEKVTEEHIEKVAKRSDEIYDHFKRPGPLGRFISSGELMLSMVRDYWEGTYREIPNWVICAVVFALLYILNPLDLIPAVFPIVGQLDDAIVLGACLLLIDQQLQEYKVWKLAQGDAAQRES